MEIYRDVAAGQLVTIREGQGIVKKADSATGPVLIAAYRDLWQVGGDEILGAEPRTRKQMAQRQTAQHALSAALDDAPTPNSLNDPRAEIGGLEPGSS